MLPRTQEFCPLSYANQWRQARTDKDLAKIFCPPDGECALAGHTNRKFPKPQNQDRLYLPYSLAWKLRRSTGYVANVRFEKTGMNAAKPASLSVVLKILWVKEGTSEVCWVYARTTAHASAFAPRQIGPCAFAHVAVGDLITGVLERPFSDQCPTNLLAWHIPSVGDAIRLIGPQVPEWWELTLEPQIVADLPQLGGLNFGAPPPSAHISLRLELPPADLNQFKEECTNPKPQPSAPDHPPPRMKDKLSAKTPTIFEDSTDLPPVSKGRFALKNNFIRCLSFLPLMYSAQNLYNNEFAVTPKDLMCAQLIRTAQDTHAFPSDRAKAMMYLEEAGISTIGTPLTPSLQCPRKFCLLPRFRGKTFIQDNFSRRW